MKSRTEIQADGGLLAWTELVLLWLAGNSLRVTVLAVPPLLPAIHRTLHLGETAVGALSALPIFLLAVAAVPGSLLVARTGPRRALVCGLCAVALAGALRGMGTSIVVLFTMTTIMGLGIAISQPALPSLVRHWFPARVGLATGVYSNGLLIGELGAAALTAPLILSLVAGRWQLAAAVWSIPVLLTSIAILTTTAHVPREVGAPTLPWWPDWRDGLTWRMGLILGGASICYWGSNAFIPDYLKATHHANLITLALTVLNLSQLPASAVVAVCPGRVVGRRWPIMAVGVTTVVAALGLNLGGNWVVILAGVLGFSAALVFILSLALPPLLAGIDDVHRLSAAMFTIAYICPFAGSLAGGAIWDATQSPGTAFLPIICSGCIMALLSIGMHMPEAK